MLSIGKLGCLPPDFAAHARVPKLIVPDDVPPPPASQDWYSKVPTWPGLENDKIGTCGPASLLHTIQGWEAYSGRVWTPTDTMAIHIYEKFGFDPARPLQTDNGVRQLDLLNAWIAGMDLGDGTTDQLAAYAAIETIDQLKYAISWFGSASIGLALPQSIVGPFEGSEWTVPATGLSGAGAKGSLGEHLVNGVGFTADGWIVVISWGGVVLMSFDFWMAYMQTTYAVVSADFSSAPGVTPAGVPYARLLEHWDAVRSSQSPIVT